MESTTSQLQQSRQDFQQLIKEGSLPPKMELKLSYLESSILGKQLEPIVIQSLPQFQKISLQMMNHESKISLFNSIVKCLSGKQTTNYFTSEKAYIKREDSSNRSVTCYLTCNIQSLKICKGKDGKQVAFTFLIDKLLVAKVYHKEKKKYFFGIAYDNVKYRIKFDQQGPCARIHGNMLAVIRQKKSLKSKSDVKSSFGSTKVKQELEIDPWDQTGQDRMFEQEKAYLCSLIQKIEGSSIHSNQGFQLVKNMGRGKVMSNTKKNSVKVLMFMEKCSIQGLIESYIQFGAWNIHVDSFKVIKKVRQNTFIGHLKMKKKNFYTSPRQAFFIITYFKLCPCLNKQVKQQESRKHYLMMSSIDHREQEVNEALSGVEMFFNQIIQFSQVKSQPGEVYINLTSEIDFNYYQYMQNSLDLSLKFLEEVNSISVLCHEREMVKSSKTQLFQYNSCVCDKSRMKDQLFPISEVRQNIQNVSQFTEQIPDLSQIPDTLPHKQIVKTIVDNNELKIAQKIVDIISKKMFQYYYLKQRFSLQVNQKPYIDSQYHFNSKPNFLMIGSKWKFNKSQQYIFIDQYQLQLQKGILKLIVKQITANLMAGKSIMSMSLPVQIFDDYSSVQSFTQVFGFVPGFMHKAIKQTQITEQIKYVSIACMFIFACNPKVSKPFNPILGQTCQSSIGGIPFYMEQISHHPPISAFFMKTQNYQVSGFIQINVDIGLNSAHTKFIAPIKVKIYKGNREYIIKLPQIELGGIMFGERNLITAGRGYCLQKNSGVYLQYSIGKQKKKLYEYKQKVRKIDLVGGVFKITKQAMERILNVDRKKSYEGIKHDEAIERTSLITGKWFGDIYFDGVCYKSVKQGPFPLKSQRVSVLLPSDCTFRLDIIYRRWRNFKKSNEEKQILQNIQRRDRKLREQYHPS